MNVSVSSESLDLGDVPMPGIFDSSTVLTVHVAANRSHGGLVIAATPFESAAGDTIPLDRIFVKLPVSGQFVPMTGPVVLSEPTGPGVRDFQLKFRVQTTPTDPAGTYTGEFQLHVGPDGIHPPVPGPPVACSIDVSTYATYAVSETKNYVHLGNVSTATDEDLTLYASGNLQTNAGMFIGLRLADMDNIDGGSFEQDGSGDLTGKIIGAMVGTKDVRGNSIAHERIDLRILLSWNGGSTFLPPDGFGDSADGMIDRSIWWLINGGALGTYDLDWQIRLYPEPTHPDGTYYFESEIVVAPLL